jgi:hypothetical protein
MWLLPYEPLPELAIAPPIMAPAAKPPIIAPAFDLRACGGGGHTCGDAVRIGDFHDDDDNSGAYNGGGTVLARRFPREVQILSAAAPQMPDQTTSKPPLQVTKIVSARKISCYHAAKAGAISRPDLR